MAGTRSIKRRASARSQDEPSVKRLKRAAKLTAKTEQKSSPLLDLPIELFDMILEYVAADAGAFLSRKSTDLCSRTGLMGVSHQVRNQYQSVLNVSASEIRTKVKDFDFSHIVKFFNKLSDRELNTLPTISLPTERKFVITLMPTTASNPEQLHSWLLRLDSTTKKGTKIAAEYTVDPKDPRFEPGQPGAIARNGYAWASHGCISSWPVSKTFDKWLPKLEEGEICSYLLSCRCVAQ